MIELGALTVNHSLMRRLLPLIVLSADMGACKEKFESHHFSAVDAAKAGEFDRGWLPKVLKPDTMDMREWHDVASNEALGNSFSMRGL